MHANRIIKWGIVLCLLAALPGLTAVLAQEETPAAQAETRSVGQAVSECNRVESEPNNTKNDADSLSMGDVICAELEPADMYGELTCWGAIDWFTFYLPSDQYVLLDARGLYISDDNWGGDIVSLWLYNETSSSVTFIDVVSTWLREPNDPVLMLDSLVAGKYILKVVYDGEMEACGQNYTLALSSPLLVSAAAANLGTGSVAGIPFQAGDILAHSDLNNGEERWTMLFDASDVGITKNVTGIAKGPENELRLTLAATQNVPGVGTVTPWDILTFDGGGHYDPGQYGDITSGEFNLSLDGSEQNFTTAGEKLDAIDYHVPGPDD